MKSKQDHIDYWKALAIDDLESAALLFEGKKYLHALFFTHLALEKTCKACWINDNDSNIPPRTHNLNFLLSQTQLHLSTMQKEFLLEMNRFQIEGRYPGQISLLLKVSDSLTANTLMNEAKQLQQWLLNKLP